MVKETYDRQTVESLRQIRDIKVILTAEGSADAFTVGDEIRLAQNNGRFCLMDENEHMIPAEICANVPLEEALTLSLVNAAFSIKKIAGNVLKAEMKKPGSFVHHGQREWSYLY